MKLDDLKKRLNEWYGMELEYRTTDDDRSMRAWLITPTGKEMGYVGLWNVGRTGDWITSGHGHKNHAHDFTESIPPAEMITGGDNPTTIVPCRTNETKRDADDRRRHDTLDHLEREYGNEWFSVPDAAKRMKMPASTLRGHLERNQERVGGLNRVERTYPNRVRLLGMKVHYRIRPATPTKAPGVVEGEQE